MAEATVLLILATLYDLRGTERLMREGAPRPGIPVARMLKGRTVGLVGFGRIAQGVAARLTGWGVNILVTARSGELPPGIERAPLERLLKESDVLSVHLPLSDETRGMLGREALSGMKRGAVLINTARGGIVDEAAVAELLEAGHLGSAAIDVFAAEPLPKESPLHAAPNVILTPHMVGHTRDSIAALVGAAVENVIRPLRGEPPLHVRNPEVLPSFAAKWKCLQRPDHSAAIPATPPTAADRHGGLS
jgi:phosphoglycerate dehydrogenase-like enzyme